MPVTIKTIYHRPAKPNPQSGPENVEIVCRAELDDERGVSPSVPSVEIL